MSQSFPDLWRRESAPRPPARRPEQTLTRTRRQTATALAGVPLFASFSKKHLQRLAADTDELTFAPGEAVVREGELGETLFVVLEGEAKVVRGKRKVGTVLPGDFFGELAAIDAQPRSASVIAVTPLRVLQLVPASPAGVARGRAPGHAEAARRYRAQRSARSSARPELPQPRPSSAGTEIGRVEERIDLRDGRRVEHEVARRRVRAHVIGVPAAGDRARHPRLVHVPRQRELGERRVEPLRRSGVAASTRSSALGRTSRSNRSTSSGSSGSPSWPRQSPSGNVVAAVIAPVSSPKASGP